MANDAEVSPEEEDAASGGDLCRRHCPTRDRDMQVLLDALASAKLQIEYLHEKFTPTGSGNAVLASIDAVLARGTT